METGYGSGRTPLRVYKPQPTYETYVSPYGPKYVADTPPSQLSSAPQKM
jgi:hypothetical protein